MAGDGDFIQSCHSITHIFVPFDPGKPMKNKTHPAGENEECNVRRNPRKSSIFIKHMGLMSHFEVNGSLSEISMLGLDRGGIS